MAKSTADTISPDVSTETIGQAPQLSNVSSEDLLGLTPAENRIFKLSNDKRRGTVIVNMEEDVIDPETGKTRRMRLLRGAQSIWFDEQPPTVFPKEYVQNNLLTLNFDKGDCVIPIHEHLKIKAAELSFRNTANQKKYGAAAKKKDIYFYEWDSAALSKSAEEEDNNILKAMQLAWTAPLAEVIPHAKYLAIQFQDDMGLQLDEKSLRALYAKYAKNNSKKFLDSLHSPIVKIAYAVKKAIAETKIDLGRQVGTAYWTDGGFICAIPEGRDAQDYLVEFALAHGEASSTFAGQLRELTK